MKLKFWGKEFHKGITITIDLYKSNGELVHSGFTTTETVVGESAIYVTDNIFNTISPIKAGIYVARAINGNGEFIDHREIIFNGSREITLLELKFLTPKEMMQLRDALGLDGDKMVARDGQLQKKSEAPYNNTVDTNEWRD